MIDQKLRCGLIAFLLLFGLTSFAWGRPEPALKDSVALWQSQKEFSYLQSLDSLLENRIEEARKPASKGKTSASGPDWLSALLSKSPVKLLLNTLAVCFILFLVYKLIGSVGFFTYRQRRRAKTDAELIETESSDALSERVEKAENEGKYDEAVRYLYLKVLLLLKDKEMISYSAQKTNADYLEETAGAFFYSRFQILTRYFDYVWYGKVQPGSEKYRGIKSDFQDFMNQIEKPH